MYMNKDKIIKHYSKVDFTKGPPIYSREDIYDALYKLGRFEKCPKIYYILDSMCGQGLVGNEISKRLDKNKIKHRIHYLDIAIGQFQNLIKKGNAVSLSEADEIPYSDESFDRVYTRFGVKNYPEKIQIKILKENRRILAKGGYFVLMDMVSPPEAYEWSQTERKEKQKFTIGESSYPHIPTLEMWLKMLEESGFLPDYENIYRTISYVITSQWVESKQMTAEELEKMNEFLLSAPSNAKKSYNIREEKIGRRNAVKIDYPVVIISAKAT